MSKRLKELADEATENQVLAQARDLAVKVRESANQIWLAGLGAFSKAQQEGAKMFEALVAEGEKVQERTKTAADERVAGDERQGDRDLEQARQGVRGPGGARAARLERSEPARISTSCQSGSTS